MFKWIKLWYIFDKSWRLDLNTEENAKDLLSESSVIGIYPVPLKKVAESLGYSIVEFEPQTDDAKDISGAVFYEQKKIVVNASEPEARKRFTIAHEIGHIRLEHANESHIDYRNQEKTPKEIHVNKFAAALLMPKSEFKRVYKALRNIYETAIYFGVSEESASYRAANLGLL